MIKDHVLFQNIKIDEPNNSGLLTTDRAYDILKAVRKKYADVILPNFNSSGSHAPFENFIQGDLDVLYLHFWLEHLKHPSLSQFFSEGSTLEFSLETSASSANTSSSYNTPSGVISSLSNTGSTGSNAKVSGKRKSSDDSIQQYFAAKCDQIKKDSIGDTSESLGRAYERRRELAKELSACTNEEYRNILKEDIKYENDLISKLRCKL